MTVPGSTSTAAARPLPEPFTGRIALCAPSALRTLPSAVEPPPSHRQPFAGRAAKARRRAGFSLLELLIAGLIFSLGMLALAYAYGQGLAFVMSSGEETIARQKARETMEGVFTALNTQHLSYSSLCNVSQGPGCIFLDGLTPLDQAGADGIYGTSDDASAGLQTVTAPGPDGLLGTADDITTPLSEFKRQIQITDLSTTLKQVQVSIQYTTTRNMVRTIQLTTYVSAYN